MTTANTNTNTPTRLNGIDPRSVQALIDGATADASNAQTHWNVVSKWQGGARNQAAVKRVEIGGETVDTPWLIDMDEPEQLCGTNLRPNPQGYLLAALNGCMMVGYAALATLHGIEIESLEIETKGDIDLRGFLGIDPDVKAGYDSLQYTVRIKSNGTDEQIQRIHETVQKTSPNYFNISQPVKLDAELISE
ncbi:MAG: OsmC family protein [Phycisphaeraceae bacterium]|nr:OsmC family protein [Phycisphaeraceae bacterium]